MNVRVRLFAAAREAAGVSTIDIEVPPGTRVRDLISFVGQRCGDRVRAELATIGMRIALNQELIDGDPALSSGDEIAFMPPVTGG